jgi:SIR2-like protein
MASVQPSDGAAAGTNGASQNLDKIPFGVVAARLKEGKVIPFLGAGASLSGVPVGPSRLPAGTVLANELREEIKPYPGDKADALTKVAQFYVECVLGRGDLYELLRKRFYTDQQKADLNVTAQLIAEIENLSCVVTTNYDDHIEEAFRRRNRDFVVVTHEVGPGRAPYVYATTTDGHRDRFLLDKFVLSPYAGRTIIYKMHGAVTPELDEHLDTVIITEDDYVNFLASPIPLPPRALTALFEKSRFLFLGYSLEDWNLRVILRRLTEEGRDNQVKHWAVQKNPADMEKLFWLKRNVVLYEASLEDFVVRLRQELK